MKTPNTAETAAASSAFAIPKKAGIIITKNTNHRTVKITPFFLVKKVLLPLYSSANWGRTPPCASNSATSPSWNPHREQNLVSSVTCCWPQRGQCIRNSPELYGPQDLMNNEFLHEKVRNAKSKASANGAAAWRKRSAKRQMPGPEDAPPGRAFPEGVPIWRSVFQVPAAA